MEYFNLLHIITFLYVAVVGSHAALTTEVYWKTMLPNSPMPKAIRDLLLSDKQRGSTKLNVGGQIGEVHVHNYVNIKYDQLDGYTDTAFTMLAKDMHQGKKLNLEFVKSTSVSTFIPRQVADSIPFSSAQFPEILNRVSVKPDSLEAEKMKLTVTQCEQAAIGEEKICATSLESLIDFTTSKLGKKVQAISTEVQKETKLQSYTITGVKKMGVNDKTTACHRLSYPYPVFYCHYTQNVKAYTVSLVGDDGTNVKAVTVCHTPTLNTVKTKPEKIPVCHLLPEDNVVWVTY